MKEEQFKKGIKNIRMNDAEKSAVLGKVFSTPIKSPYINQNKIFAFVLSSPAKMILVGCLVLMLAGGGSVFASEKALPGDLLYPMKTKVVEPFLGMIQSSSGGRLAWAETKIERRLQEAKTLSDENKLGATSTEELKKNIKKNSQDYVQIVESVASSTATSTSSIKESVQKLKQNFRDKINREAEDNSSQTKIQDLKDEVFKVLDKGDSDQRGDHTRVDRKNREN